jgi:hypothetical protein
MRYGNEILLLEHIETYFIVKMNNIPFLDEWDLLLGVLYRSLTTGILLNKIRKKRTVNGLC